MAAVPRSRFFLLLCLLLTFAYPVQASSSPAARQRVIVKLHSPFAKNVESSLTITKMTLVRGQSMDAAVQAFMDRHAATRLRPAYPQIVKAKRRGLTDLQIATDIRNRNPVRAGRFRGNFHSTTVTLVVN